MVLTEENLRRHDETTRSPERTRDRSVHRGVKHTMPTLRHTGTTSPRDVVRCDVAELELPVQRAANDTRLAVGVPPTKDAAPHSDPDQRRRRYPATDHCCAEPTKTNMVSTAAEEPHHGTDTARNVGRMRATGGPTSPGPETGSAGYPTGYPTGRHGHIGTARRERGFTGDNATKWRTQYKTTERARATRRPNISKPVESTTGIQPQ